MLGFSDQLSSNFPMLCKTYHGFWLVSEALNRQSKNKIREFLISWKVYPVMKKYQIKYLAMAIMLSTANESSSFQKT
jgi:hypothetical protein